MNVLVLNCGSSSVKFQIIDTDPERIEKNEDRRLARGIVERLGENARLRFQVEGRTPDERQTPLQNHRAALDSILSWIASPGARIDGVVSITDIHAVGHRVVHGGERFVESQPIGPDVLAGIEEYSELAPLHNPANLRGIEAAREMLGPEVPQVAVFDTAFHSTIPETSFLYGIPYELYHRHRIRRYGFHGTSHRYVSERYRAMLGIERDRVKIITLHLGNGCSACAIKGGDSFDTSMGFTPLEGLLMGTRSGDIDASILEYLARVERMTLQQIDSMLNERSGLLGLSGRSADMRDLLEREDEDRRARIAIDLFCHRARKYIGAYFVVLQGADAVVFTGGIGENSSIVRRRICEGLQAIGLHLDPGRNEHLDQRKEISTDGSSLKAFVIPTDEELLIARDTCHVVTGTPRRR